MALCLYGRRQADGEVRASTTSSTRRAGSSALSGLKAGIEYEALLTVELVERNGKTTMTQSFLFPTQELRDTVMKTGLTPQGMSAFYERLGRAAARDASRCSIE